MDTKHTPGPWKVSQNVSRHVVGPNGGIVTCGELTWDGPGSSAVADANARLIAAAPELLEALRRMEVAANTVAYCHDKHRGNFAAALSEMESDAEAARAVIAKATGSVP